MITLKTDIRLSKKEQAIYAFIMREKENILVLTEHEIANGAQVSPATVSRFFRKIGFQNFKEFKRSQRFSQQVGPLDKFHTSFKETTSFSNFIEQRMKHLSETKRRNTQEEIHQAAQLISETKILYINCHGPSAFLGELFKFRLQRFGIRVILLNRTGHDLYEELALIEKNSVILFLLFSNIHPENYVLNIHAQQLQQKIIFMTDVMVLPEKMKYDVLLHTIRGEIYEFHSMIAPLALLEHLLLLVGTNRKETSIKQLEKLESLRKEYEDYLPRTVKNI